MSDPPTWRPPRTPTAGFHINYSALVQRFRGVKSLWTAEERPAPARIRTFLSWPALTHEGGAERLGLRFSDIYYAKLDIGQDYDWFFVHFLGRGGFGAVGLFEKTPAEENRKEDEIVVKTTRARTDLAIYKDANYLFLAKEAALMGQTNDLGEDGHVTLRNYKYYESDAQWKLYFEYCPYGDLERLRMRYKAYGRYLPELFLWHVFYWLSKSVYEYSKKDIWRNTNPARWGNEVPGGYFTHFDIKPQNILLGPPDPELTDDVDLYPIPRMADLGLADILQEGDRRTIAADNVRGTTKWRPPELQYRKIDAASRFYPFGERYLGNNRRDAHRKGYHPVTSKSNLWAIGAVMFSLLTLKESDFLYRRILSILQEFTRAPDGPDESIINDTDWEILPDQYYSQALRDLIRKCLRLNPDHRPSEQEVFEEAEDGYETFLNTLRNKGFGGTQPGAVPLHVAVATDPEYRVYFEGNEIDGAADNYRFDHPDRDQTWWSHRFVEDMLWVPPEWGRLWPRDMPDSVHLPSSWPHRAMAEFFAIRDARRKSRNRREAEEAQAGEQDDHNRQQQQQPIPVALPQQFGPRRDADTPDPRVGTVPPGPDQAQRFQQVPQVPQAAPAQPARRAPATGAVDDSSSGMAVDLPFVAPSSPPGPPPGPARIPRRMDRFAPYFIPRRGGRR